MSKHDVALESAFDDHQIRDTASAERNLMRAILRSAMDDLSKRGEPQRQARTFFLSEDDYYLYSFPSICSHLGLCAKTIRNRLGIIAGQKQSEDIGSTERALAVVSDRV